MAPNAARVALVSAAEYAHLDDDLPPILAGLAARGVDAVVADWHDKAFAWANIDLAVIRSTWDYTWHLDEFVGWVDRVDRLTRLANPGPAVRWNLDKRYMLDLAAAGVPTVATRIVDVGDPPELGPAPAVGEEIVVKPVVSAGARDTERYGADRVDDARAHVVRLQEAGRAAMVQPYLPDVDRLGETGLVYLGDRLSHGFRKGPILVTGSGFVDGLYREERISARVPSDPEVAVAEAALDAVADFVPGASRRDLLYARVDVVPHEGGHVVLELELVEPSFFCSTDAGAADRVVAVIAEALKP